MRKIIGPDVSFFTKCNLCDTIPGDRMLVSRGKRVASLDAQQLQLRTAMGVNQNENALGRESDVANHLGISRKK